ncbi:hypothetical protein NU08_0727 [Flavobacterium anhuiense]|uniref:Uncharacterized protein n=1 Tax=Flavobacterium anhuiense TaxID=459526 RepID=A0A444W227_9FLAO|nr:hypothetical protein NU08_0727 [Flavobacterium anhuiense]
MKHPLLTEVLKEFEKAPLKEDLLKSYEKDIFSLALTEAASFFLLL